MNRNDLAAKLCAVTTDLFREKGYVAFVDVFVKLGYLDPRQCEDWRMKRVPYLERVIQANLSRITFVMKTVRQNCRRGHCRESWTGYHSWGKGPKMPLRFSKSGDPAIERAYATHFLKPLGRSQSQVEDSQP
jgi:hypothetical protein